MANIHHESEMHGGYGGDEEDYEEPPEDPNQEPRLPRGISYVCPALLDLTGMAQASRSYSVSPDGSHIALLNRKVPRVRINDASGTKTVLLLEGHSAEHMEWSRDGKRFALAEEVKQKTGTREHLSTRILLADLEGSAQREVLLPGLTASRIRFSWDGGALWVLSDKQDELVTVDFATATAKTVLVRAGLHWLLPGPKYVFAADAHQYLFIDPKNPSAPKVAFTPKDEGRVMNTEWTEDGSALFLYHADTTRQCLRDADPAPSVETWRHSHAELLRLDESGASTVLQQIPEPQKAQKLVDEKANKLLVKLETPERQFIHTIWRSPDGQRFAAIASDKSFIYDAAGKLVRTGPGGSGMRWRRDSKAMLLTQGDKVLELDAKSGAAKVVAQGLPFKSNRESSELALVDPDYLGGKVIYTLFRVAADPEDDEGG